MLLLTLPLMGLIVLNKDPPDMDMSDGQLLDDEEDTDEDQSKFIFIFYLFICI